MHGCVVEFSPCWTGRANGVDMRPWFQPCAFQEGLQSICSRYDHVGTAHSRLEVHRLCTMQRSKALRVIGSAAPHPHFLELADVAKSIKMCVRLHPAPKQCEHLRIVGRKVLRHSCGQGGGSHLCDKSPIHERERLPRRWL